jgi:hypothetical protein
VWHREGKGLTQPRPIDSLELRYDYAFGGIDASDPEEIVEDARNPVGRGIASDLATLERQAGPQIESPYETITDAADRPEPMGSRRDRAPLGASAQALGQLWGRLGGETRAASSARFRRTRQSMRVTGARGHAATVGRRRRVRSRISPQAAERWPSCFLASSSA